MAGELLYVMDAAEKDPSVRVVVLKGSPKAFSAGGDIGYFYQLIQAGGFMICADNAKFILAFVNLGLVPDTGATYLRVLVLHVPCSLRRQDAP